MSQAESIQVVLSGVNPTVQAVLHKAGFDTMLCEENICSHINLALERAKQLV
jgi:SulP family sulfate permease